MRFSSSLLLVVSGASIIGILASVACGSSSTSPPPDAGAEDASTNDSSLADAIANDASNVNDASDAANADGGPAPAPPTGDPITGLTLFDGWTDPRALAAPVDTDGWEDCSYIAASGKRLYFGYTRADYAALSQGVIMFTGPSRPGESRDLFEIYEATIQNGAWNVLPSTVNTGDTTISEAAEGVDDGEQTMAFVRYGSGANAGDLYISKKVNGTWGVATMLPAPINTSCVEDNAALSADGTRLYFDSNRADVLGTTCKATSGSETRDIYVSTLTAGAWSVPTLVTGEPAMGIIHWQVYPRSDTTALYWAGLDATCGDSSCIYRATKQPDGSYQGRVVVAKAVSQATAQVGDAYAIGEVSITQDGKYMYFTYILKSSADGGFDGGSGANLNIGVARKM